MDIDNPTLDMRRRDSDLQRGAAKEGAGEAFAQQRTASRRVAHTEGERRVAAPTRRARAAVLLYYTFYRIKGNPRVRSPPGVYPGLGTLYMHTMEPRESALLAVWYSANSAGPL